MGRHSLESTHRRYQIEQMWDVHHEIVRMALMGMKYVEIAETLGISPVTVSYTLRSPIVMRQLEQMRAVRDFDAIDVAKEIAALAPKAVQVLGELLEAEAPNIRKSAADSILDRAGHAAVQRIKQDVTVTHFTPREIDDIKQRAKNVGLLIDAEFETSETKRIAQ